MDGNCSSLYLGSSLLYDSKRYMITNIKTNATPGSIHAIHAIPNKTRKKRRRIAVAQPGLLNGDDVRLLSGDQLTNLIDAAAETSCVDLDDLKPISLRIKVTGLAGLIIILHHDDSSSSMSVEDGGLLESPTSPERCPLVGACC